MGTLGEQVSGLDLMDKLASLCKRRGFVFPNSEIYSGLSGFWDFGPLGVALKRNLERFWWDYMVRRRDNIVGLDSALIGPEAVWKASGHVAQFHDLLVDDKETKERFRIDQLQYGMEEHAEQAELFALKAVENQVGSEEDFWNALKEEIGYLPRNPNTGKEAKFTLPRQFNLMFKQHIGATGGEQSQVGYLRAETCQPIFVNFDTVQTCSRQKVPFGIAQIGKAFRNEINPRNFLFRAREFSQMEMEFFVRPDSLIEQLKAANAPDNPGAQSQPSSLSTTMQWYDYWLGERRAFYTALGISDNMLRIHDHPEAKLAHYATAACDIEFNFPFGWGELEGIHHRGDFDLTQHRQHSGKKIEYFDDEAHQALVAHGMNKDEARELCNYLPNVIETSGGIDRALFAVLVAAYDEDKQETKHEGKAEDIRIVLRLHPRLAPITCAVLPLSRKLSGPDSKAYQLYTKLLDAGLAVEFDDAGSIGKRYRRHDEIGTPWCITYDFDSEDDNAVTIRDRDSLEQERVPLADVPGRLGEMLTQT
jgi:glycyl-tRNA synthetase